MSRALPSVQSLWNNYPLGSREQVKQAIGGHVNAAWIRNTCTIRLSRAFNEAGDVIPGQDAAAADGMHVVSGADKKWYAYRVAEFHKYMVNKYGNPMSLKGTGGVPSGLAGKKGVIEFVVAFSDASGHFDIWNGTNCKYEEFFSRANVINLWY